MNAKAATAPLAALYGLSDPECIQIAILLRGNLTYFIGDRAEVGQIRAALAEHR